MAILTMSLSSMMVMPRPSSAAIAAFTTRCSGSGRMSTNNKLGCTNNINGAATRRNFHQLLPLSSTSVSPDAAVGSTTDDRESLLQRRSEILRGNSKLSLAPMMEYTDRHFRHLVRLLSDRTLLYTEMVAANAIAHERDNALSPPDELLEGDNNDAEAVLKNTGSLVDSANFDPSYLLRFLGQGHNPEGPSVLQLGGSDPDQLFLAARTVYEFNQLQKNQQSENMQQSQKEDGKQQPPIFCDYSAINLNCGCPSPKVAGKGCFGAALMEDPDLVRRSTTSLYEGAGGTMPITVKCRIGTDEGYAFTQKEYLSRDEDTEYQNLKRFVEIVASDGIVTDFQIHARIAVLNKNYSPADNRKVPPLRYHHVQRLAREFPELNISLNGGVETLAGVKRELDECSELDGVMVGRGFVANPWAFAMADQVLYMEDEGGLGSLSSGPKNRMEVLEAYGRHADYEEQHGDPVKIRRFMTKAVSHLFAGEPNAKRYRIALDDMAGLPKKRAMELKQNPNLVQDEQPPLSELIMNIATTHLREEVLYRSPKESFDKLLWDEEQAERKRNVVSTVVLGAGKKGDDEGNVQKSLVQEWQSSRKADELNERAERKLEANGV